MKRLFCLLLTGAAVFCLFVGTAWLCAEALTARTQPAAPDAPLYTLGVDGGQVALYHSGSSAPVARYEIYTALLPAPDVARLRQGIPLESEAMLRRCLEDLGA